MKFTCTSWSWPLLPFDDVVRIMSVLGFRAIDVGAFAGLAHFEPAQLAQCPKQMADQVSTIGRHHRVVFSDLFVAFGPDLADHCVNFPDRSVTDANLKTFRKISEFCHVAAIPGITLCPGVEHAKLGRKASLDLAIEELARLADAGHRAGLRVSFEPHLKSITESPEDTLKLVGSVPHLSLTLDYSHFVAQGYPESHIEPLLKYAGHIHVRQAKAGTLQAHDDDGTVNFNRMMSALQSLGYAGWVAFEYECNAWQGNNRSDVVSETILLKRRLSQFETQARAQPRRRSMRLAGKIALVTGAGRGIGRAISKGYAREGAHVAIAEIDPNTGESAAREVRGLGRRSLFIQTDMSRRDQIDAIVDNVLAEFGRIDILVNNAGIHLTEPFLEVTEESYDRILDTNLKGPFFCAQTVARYMVGVRRGKIINMSSVSAEIADPGSSHYCVAKGGLQMLTRAMALELAKYNVQVNAIAPGTIKTDLGGWYETPEASIFLEQRVPFGRFGTPEEVVGAAVFLASDESAYVTGASILVDGGLRTA